MQLHDDGIFLGSTELAVYRHIERLAFQGGALTAVYSATEIADAEGIKERRVQQIIKGFGERGLIERLGNRRARVNLPPNQAGRDLSNANLADVNLYGVDLHGANLTGADLTGANLVAADISEANLTDANLEGADWSESNARGARFTGSNLKNSRAYGAKMEQVDLQAATLKGFRKNSMIDHRHGTLGARLGRNVHDWICIANDPPTIANLLRRQLHDVPGHQLFISRILAIDGIVIGCWQHALQQLFAQLGFVALRWGRIWAEDEETDIYARFQLFHQAEILRYIMDEDEDGLEAYFARMEQLAPTAEWKTYFRWHQREHNGKLENLITPQQMLEIAGSYSPFSFDCDFRSETLPLGRPRLPHNHLVAIDATLAQLPRPDALIMAQWMRQAAGLSDVKVGIRSQIRTLDQHPAIQEASPIPA